MNREEFCKETKRLEHLSGAQVSADQAEEWLNFFGNMPASAYRDGIDEYLKSGDRFPPTAKSLLEHMAVAACKCLHPRAVLDEFVAAGKRYQRKVGLPGDNPFPQVSLVASETAASFGGLIPAWELFWESGTAFTAQFLRAVEDRNAAIHREWKEAVLSGGVPRASS